MTREEAARILDEVIPPPDHHTVDLDHLRIAQAWAYVKETLTAEPVKHGRWIYIRGDENIGLGLYECSECHKRDIHGKDREVPYCWNCGAKMDLDNAKLRADELYDCDPEKNAECRKTGCYINGGECRHTTHAEYAKEDRDGIQKPD